MTHPIPVLLLIDDSKESQKAADYLQGRQIDYKEVRPDRQALSDIQYPNPTLLIGGRPFTRLDRIIDAEHSLEYDLFVRQKI